MLSDTTIQQVQALIAKYPIARGALIPALHAVQDAAGFLSKEDMAELGDLFNLDPAEVESVASFYTMFYYRPQPTCMLQLCTNVSCMYAGGYQVLKHIEDSLGIKPGQVTPDGRFGLMEVECLAACDIAPCLQINDEFYYAKVDAAKMDAILAHVQAGHPLPAPGIEPNPLQFTDRPAWIPIEPVDRTQQVQPAAPEAKPAAGPAAAAAPPQSPAQKAAQTVVNPVVADAAHEEALRRIEEAKRARELAAIRAVEEEKKAAERKLQREREEFLRQAREKDEAAKREAERRKAAEIAAAAAAIGEAATIAPPKPLEVEYPAKVVRKIIEPGKTIERGMKIGGAAPAFAPPRPEPAPPPPVVESPPEPSPVSEPEIESAPNPEPEAKVAPRSDANLEAAPDLPAWEPENPYLRLIQQSQSAEAEERADA